MNRQRIIWLVCGVLIMLCGAAYFLIARPAKCDQFADPSVSSPNGEWVAVSTGDACPIGLLSVTDYSVSVTLGHESPSTQAKPTVIFDQTDAGALPTLRWASANELVVRLNDPGEVQSSQHQSGRVKISYVVPNWLWRNTQTIEVDRARQANDAQELYKQGKISEKDLRDELETNNAVAKERTSFRQWIVNNAIVEAPSN